MKAAVLKKSDQDRSFAGRYYKNIIKITIALSIFLSPPPVKAADVSLEKDIHHQLETCLRLAGDAIDKCSAGKSCSGEIARIKTIGSDLKASFLLLDEGFREREKSMTALGKTALKRHQTMAEEFRKSLDEYLSLIDGLSPEGDGRSQMSTLTQLKTLLDKTLHKRKRPVTGSLPYRNLNYPVLEPSAAAVIAPAYRGGSTTVVPEDLKGSPEAPVDREIAALAQSLNWSPVEIYEYVKNNIETEWYWGAMKGALETLRQKSGNDADQAALLVALLRAAGFPARYVRGTIEFFPGIEKVKNLTGIDDPNKIAVFFQKSGIPFKPVISGGRIINFQIEHIWVEAQIPYSNYRGALIDEHGKTWLGLDTSLKVRDYQYGGKYDITANMSMTGLRDEYLGQGDRQEPLSFIRTRIQTHLQSRPELFYNDLLRKRTLPAEEMNFLPASLQFDQKRITNEYTALPDDLKHKIKLTATDKNNAELLNITLNVLAVSNQKVELFYEPETVEDQQIINSYGGLDNTPSYLVRLRPAIRVNGERMIVARDGLPMGEEFNLKIDLISPDGTESFKGVHIAGNLSILGIVAQKSVTPAAVADESKDAAQLLYEEAINYIGRWNQAEDELAALLQLNAVRPTPTVAVVGGVVDVAYLLDTPHDYAWKGVYLDAGWRTINVQPASGADDRQKLFMQLSALQGSVLENKIFEDDFKVDAVSAAKLMQIAGEQSVPVFNITRDNAADVLPGLSFDDNIKQDIANAVNRNCTVRIPGREITWQDWTGIGYIKENPETGEAGYMLSGMIAGGMTAWSADKWPGDYALRLANPNTKLYDEPSAYSPSGDIYIQKISVGDLQRGTVGMQLPKFMQVKVYTISKKDGTKNPAFDKDVIFKVVAGGGTFTDGSTTKTVRTDKNGIAWVSLVLGQKTSDNRAYAKMNPKDMYTQQVGENIVSASLASGLSTEKPFTAWGFPDVAHHLRKTNGDGYTGTILNYSGFLAVIVEDQYDNPVSNKVVTFTVGGMSDDKRIPINCSNANIDVRPAELIEEGDPCVQTLPTLDQCKSRKKSIPVTSSASGAAVGVILGGAPYTKYNFTASVEGIEKPVDFNQYTLAFGACEASRDPQVDLYVTYLYPSDEYGHNINAGQAGSKIPVQAFMYFLKENETTAKVKVCDPEFECTKVSGGREYEFIYTNKDHSPEISFGGQTNDISIKQNGLYETTYTLQPGVNRITVSGSATLKQQNRTELCPSCQPTKKDITRRDSVEMKLYGVNIAVDPIPAVLVDDKGYARNDCEIRYTITPAEYKAASATIFIYKDGEIIVAIPTEAQSAGSGKISAGFQMDLESIFEAEVVLNYGSSIAISSGKKRIVVARLSTESNDDEVVNPDKDERIGYGDGKFKQKLYHIHLKSKIVNENCNNDKIKGKIRIINKDGQKIEQPGETYCPVEYDLDFTLAGITCQVKIKDGEKTKDKFIVSNRTKEDFVASETDLGQTVVLYGGNRNYLEEAITITSNSETKEIKQQYAIEPLQVIVIGIDGLRQDVLSVMNNVNDGNKYYTPISDLPGLKQILKGYEKPLPEKQYIELEKVTAIFPSITLASWASIFTGKMPKDTGITGNEFFARDLSYGVPSSFFRPPVGMITFDGGAFPGYSECGIADKILGERYIVPFRKYWFDKANPMDIPQNVILKTGSPTIFETLTKDENIKGYYEKNGGDAVVVAYSHYARGASRWLTHGSFEATPWPLPVKSISSKALDSASWTRFQEYLNNWYMTDILLNKRNKVPFSALTVWYLPGLDHEAHINGMGSYKTYFKSNTDSFIKKFVEKLKDMGEFYNKVFIIVADHGTTAMPESSAMKYIQVKKDEDGNITSTRPWYGYDACELQLEKMDKDKFKYTEQANNNLHIWELGEMLKNAKKNKLGDYLILAPKEISVLYEVDDDGDLLYGATEVRDKANVIVAMNGPMAHIYIKSGNSWANASSDINKLKLFAGLLKAYFMDGGVKLRKKDKDKFTKLLSSVNKILIRDNGVYKEFIGYNASLSELSLGNEYVNGGTRIAGMNDLNRSGDLVLIMNDFKGGDAIYRYTTGVACKAWHGSLNASDSYVPMIVAYPGGKQSEIKSFVDIACPSNTCEGNWKMPDIIQEILKKQYPVE